MANTIAVTKEYIANLDEVYRRGSLTQDLNANPLKIRKGAIAGEYLVNKYKMDGLGDYDRNTGYVQGEIITEWETIKANYDRGRKFVVDVLDNEESAEVAFGELASQFVKHKVVPEGDAFTFATIASTNNITKLTPKSFTKGKDLRDEVITAMTKMDEDEVYPEGRILYVTPTNYNLLFGEENTFNKDIFDLFFKVVKVPQTRFYTEIELKDGKGAKKEGGYAKKATTGKDMNFMIVQKDAVIKTDIHIASDIIPPALNADSDGYIQKYRKHGLVYVYENMTAGIAISTKA